MAILKLVSLLGVEKYTHISTYSYIVAAFKTEGNVMEKLKSLCRKYKHGLPLLTFAVIYLSWFSYLERTVTRRYQVIHMGVDDYIPFLEVFIIPYFLWFVYVAGVVIYFLFTSKTDYFKACAFLFTGMTIFLIVSTLWPNGHHLRPMVMPHDNLLTKMVAFLYQTDTPTNLWPSIHVYNSLGAHFAIIHSRHLADKKWLHWVSLGLSSSIIMSTVFLKQHSMFDVLTAFIMAAVMYAVVYRYDLVTVIRMIRAKKKVSPQIT